MVTTAAEEAVVSIEDVKDSFRLGVPSLFMVFLVLSYSFFVNVIPIP